MNAAAEPRAFVGDPCSGPLTRPPSKALRTGERPARSEMLGSGEALE